LSTREGDGGEKEEVKSDHGKVSTIRSDSFAEDAEKQALLAQESKLKRFKSRKMEQFWKGLKKEHELLVVFGRRGSALSKLGTSSRRFSMNQTPPTKGVLFQKETGSMKDSSKSPMSTTSSEIDGQLMKLAAAGRAGDGEGQKLARKEKIQELEEFVSTAHRSTVLLTQLLSFLAMAVFFYEANESLFSEERWLQIRTANAATATYLILENVMEGIVQVLLTVPITFTMVAIFKQLDQAGTARVLFEMRVATDQAKLLHGIVQSNPVDLRRSIHEVEGLLRIINEKASKRKEDIMVVKYTLNLIKTQLKNVREHQKEQDAKALERKIIKFRSSAKNFKVMAGFRCGERSESRREGLVLVDMGVLSALLRLAHSYPAPPCPFLHRNIKAAHKVEVKKRREVEDVLVKLCSLDPLHQALFLKDRRAMTHMKGR
jgi:hypothetical protein